MTAWTRLLVILFVCASASAAPVPKAVKKSPSDTLVGEWREVKHDVSGEPTPAATGYNWKFETDGTAAVIWPDGTIVPATYKLDDEGAVKKYDWTLTQHTVRFLGVYELRGDTLRTAVVSADHARPDAVKPIPKVEYRTYVRVKSSD